MLRVEWLGERPKVDRERALAELARRYLAGHGPAAEADLPNGHSCRYGRCAPVCRRLRRSSVSMATAWSTSAAEPAAPAATAGSIRPLLLGWRSRAFVLDGAKETNTINGIIKPVALVGGRAAGTWTMPQGRVELRLWHKQTQTTSAALKREAAAVEVYLKAGCRNAFVWQEHGDDVTVVARRAAGQR